jgi:predicted membrane chloride channel (bestrophin family)
MKARGRKSVVAKTIDELYLNDPVKIGFLIDATITSHEDYLDTPFTPIKEQDLLNRVSSFLAAYHNLLKFSTTPRPFPTVQMGRTTILAWIISLPFALTSDEEKNLFGSVFLVFLITYGFMGLTLAETEMHDPLGKDANDIETDLYANVRAHHFNESVCV